MNLRLYHRARSLILWRGGLLATDTVSQVTSPSSELRVSHRRVSAQHLNSLIAQSH